LDPGFCLWPIGALFLTEQVEACKAALKAVFRRRRVPPSFSSVGIFELSTGCQSGIRSNDTFGRCLIGDFCFPFLKSVFTSGYFAARSSRERTVFFIFPLFFYRTSLLAVDGANYGDGFVPMMLRAQAPARLFLSGPAAVGPRPKHIALRVFAVNFPATSSRRHDVL